ncbi:hypothetical protein GOBAR_DD34999 [Gossypium barbadense]|nr:hypothetical protein GOBAR_DD34999 [Gossypium barbadense]
MRKMDKRAFTSFLMLLWQLWEARNLFVIQGQTKVASSGAIVRDHEGMVLADYACSITEAFDAPSAKAIASACTA